MYGFTWYVDDNNLSTVEQENEPTTKRAFFVHHLRPNSREYWKEQLYSLVTKNQLRAC